MTECRCVRHPVWPSAASHAPSKVGAALSPLMEKALLSYADHAGFFAQSRTLWALHERGLVEVTRWNRYEWGPRSYPRTGYYASWAPTAEGFAAMRELLRARGDDPDAAFAEAEMWSPLWRKFEADGGEWLDFDADGKDVLNLAYRWGWKEH